MKFVILYANRDKIRRAVEKIILDGISKGYDFSKGEVRTPQFETRFFWPDKEELENFSFDVQCEEVIFKNNKLSSVRRLIIDVESKQTDNTCVAVELYEPS